MRSQLKKIKDYQTFIDMLAEQYEVWRIIYLGTNLTKAIKLGHYEQALVMLDILSFMNQDSQIHDQAKLDRLKAALEAKRLKLK